MGSIVYYSGATGNTHHFVKRLGISALRILKAETDLLVEHPYILITPTYADGAGNGAVPKAVIHFLNDRRNRAGIRAVIAGGNRSFGTTFALAGKVIAEKCSVPCLYCFELRGTDEDVSHVYSLIGNKGSGNGR